MSPSSGESGNIIGAALTTTPTPHSISFAIRKFYVWCAFDTLFIPGLVDELAEVKSTCPVSSTPVRLRVAPDGVLSVDPPDTVISVILPGLPGVDAFDQEIGLASAT